MLIAVAAASAALWLAFRTRGFAVISSMGLAVLTPLVAIALAVLIAFDQMTQKNLRQPHARRA